MQKGLPVSHASEFNNEGAVEGNSEVIVFFRVVPRRIQRFPDALVGEKFSQGRTVYENDGVRMWVDEGDDVAVSTDKAHCRV